MFIDYQVFSFINQFAGRWQLLDKAAFFCAVHLGRILLISLVILLLLDFKKYWRMVVEAILAALLVRFVLVTLLSIVHFRARPFIHNQVNLLIQYDPQRTSFPSGHASFYFALSAIVYFYNKKAGILFFAASFLISIARVFSGVHWPSDVVAGAVLGIGMGWILNKLFKKVKPIQ